MPNRLKISGILGLSFVALIAGQRLAASPARPAAQVEPGRYKLETSHARVLFSVSHAGLSNWYGEFPGATGTLDLDPGHLERSRLDVQMPTAGVDTNNAVLDAELRGDKWLDAARYPTIRFRSRRIVPTGPAAANVVGDLTLHGVTRSVTLQARFNKAGINPFAKTYTLGFEVSGSLRRSDFGVTEDVPLVGDEVTLIISAPFEKLR